MSSPEIPASDGGTLLRTIADRVLVERATGVLMYLLRLDAEEAAAVLHRWSVEADVEVDALADSLVNVICLPAHPRAQELRLLRQLHENLLRERPDGDEE
jgi:3-methyladenine DNA glycosylase AlkC